MDYYNIAKRVINEEAEALSVFAQNIPADFERIIPHILSLKGRVILMGMGKSGHIAKKIAASFASTGTPAFFIHPAEASHGDLGMITDFDLVVMLSNSGETKELFDTINYCKRFHVKIAGITMKSCSTVAKNSDFLLNLPEHREVSIISAPTTSALLMLALGDALVTAIHEAKGFSKDDFLLFHPGGKIGANLLKVQNLMHKDRELPIVNLNSALDQIILVMNEKRLGCCVVVDETINIAGIITDGDIRKNIFSVTSKLAKDIMSKNPVIIPEHCLAHEALYIMNNKAITMLPVEKNNKLCGLIHLHDILKAGVS